MLIGCIFCHYVHTARGTLNTHLNLYVPEMAAARGAAVEADGYHHVGMIRELRWVERSRLEHKITWKLSPDPDVRAVLQAYSTLIYHAVNELDRDAYRARQFRNVDTAFWSSQIHAALTQYRRLPPQTRRWHLDHAVQASLAIALAMAELSLPRALPAASVVSTKAEINSISAGNVGPKARLTNAIDDNTAGGVGRRVGGDTAFVRSFNAQKRAAIVVESSPSDTDDDDMPSPTPVKRKYRQPPPPPKPHRNFGHSLESDDDDDDDDEPQPATHRRKRPAPAVPRAHIASPDSDPSPRVTTTRSPSVFATPARSYTSTARWNVPLAAPAPRTVRTPVRTAPSTLFSPPIDPQLTLHIAVFGSHTAVVRIYPSLTLAAVLDRAFERAPRALAGLRSAARIRGVGAGCGKGWRRYWDEEAWRRVLRAAGECECAPVWKAEVVCAEE